MQDKEFDQLFRNKLEEAEIEPSKDLWKGIEARLEPKRKAGLPVFWMAAALALVLMSAGLLLKKTEKIQLQGREEMVEHIDRSQTDPTRMPVASVPSTDQMAYTGTPLVIAPSIDVEYKTVNAAYVKPQKKKNVVSTQPAEPSTRLHSIPLVSAGHADIKENLETAPMMASVAASATEADGPINDNSPAEKKGIRNVGDLVNFVVEKVDKREQKFLKFNTDEDDNSSLVAINIGFIKLNSRQHK